jgi:hypothetical protein
MAVLQGITGAVRSQIAGRINSAVSSTLRSGVGSLSGAARGGATSALNAIPSKNKFSTDVMLYPSNVGSARQGHYIMFNINEFTPGKIKAAKAKKDFESIKQQVQEDNPFATDEEVDKISSQKLAGFNNKANIAKSGGGAGRSILAEKPTKRMPASISLYMPPSVSVTYNVKYADQEIGTLAGMGSAAIAAFQNESGDNTAKLKAAGAAMKGGAKEGLTNFINTTLDTLAPGARALQQIESGKVITPRMEMMFEGVGRRNFSFTFAFIPKSAEEARSIEKIIYTFKENMMPEYVGDSRREMKIPNTFDITYMHQNTENKYMNKISSCFLRNMNVTYGGDRFTAYSPTDGSPPPQKSTIQLDFVEIETLSKDMVKEGF